MSYAALSALISTMKEDADQGLIPPAANPILLTTSQVHNIETCEAETKRPFCFVYAGNYRVGSNQEFTARFGGARHAYARCHDNQKFFVARYFHGESKRSTLSKCMYQEFMSPAVFALAARGDNTFSCRPEPFLWYMLMIGCGPFGPS